MSRKTVSQVGLALLGALATVSCGEAPQAARNSGGDDALIANAMSAAPDHIARGATVLVRQSDGQMRVLRQGSNDYTCMPDNPDSPGNMPMCVDAAGLAWVTALMRREEPPAGAPVSIAYMLQGSSFPSYDDPFPREPATEPRHYTGPVLMIMNVRGILRGFPVQDPSPEAPFVMYQGTAYEHLMVPVRPPTGAR